MKKDNDKKKVTVKWLVTVKLYGTIPIKLLNKINKKLKNKKGNKIWVFMFKLFFNIFFIKSNKTENTIKVHEKIEFLFNNSNEVIKTKKIIKKVKVILLIVHE